PDYSIETRARAVYSDLLVHLQGLRDRGEIWMTVPGEVDRWWRNRQQMTLVPHRRTWRIVGPDSHRARLAYASIDGNHAVSSLHTADLDDHDQSAAAGCSLRAAYSGGWGDHCRNPADIRRVHVGQPDRLACGRDPVCHASAHLHEPRLDFLACTPVSLGWRRHRGRRARTRDHGASAHSERGPGLEHCDGG